jgi:hypothetical protein
MLLKKVMMKRAGTGAGFRAGSGSVPKCHGPGTLDKMSSLEAEQQTMFFKGWKIQKILPFIFFFV